jgi:APA family basic amino acid/polyamine antiporter
MDPPVPRAKPREPLRTDSLPPVLGLFDATALVVGSIIGSGVFLKASAVARVLDHFGLIALVWGGVGLITLFGTLALAELAAALPHAGGPYIYLREAYGRLVAFLWGWTEFWVVRSGSLGALSCATVIYASQVFQLPDSMHGPAAVALILLLTLLNWRSTRWGATVQSATTVIKIGFLLTLITLPWLLAKADPANLDPLWPSHIDLDIWRAIGIAVVAVMWAYDGWINLAPVAEEVREPQKNIPLALGFGLSLVGVLYVAANTSYHLVLPVNRIADSPAVASDVFAVLLGSIGVPIAALGVMCSTFGATQSNMLVGPRIYFAMARDGLLPRRMARVHAQYATPANAVIVQGIWAAALVAVAYSWTDDPMSAFDTLTDFVIFGGSLFYALAVAAVFVLRLRRPDLPRPYRTWGYPWTPALYLLAFAAVLVSMLIDKWQQSAAGSVIILAGVVYYACLHLLPFRRPQHD